MVHVRADILPLFKYIGPNMFFEFASDFISGRSKEDVGPIWLNFSPPKIKNKYVDFIF